VETGRLDELGHKLGARLAAHIETELETLVDQITALLECGWTRIRVVTDHGWLLVPSGLPRIQLPSHLAATKWSRCATVKGDSKPNVPIHSWHWNVHVRIASPPGAGSFAPNTEYSHGRPFAIESLRPIQMSKSDVLDVLARARKTFTTEEWINLLIRSIGLEPSALSERARRVALLRMVPFVERNFNLVELGPRGTGKSHLFQQISPYAHLISGGKATVAKMFVNNASGQRGLVCQYDVVCFDEVSGISFDQKDGVNIMKGYMASGQFSRGKENIRADGGIVMVGNFDVDVEQQQRISHLLSPLPPKMRNDTAFMDRLHAFVPGWDFPKLNPNDHFTNHFGLVSDFLSECWSKLRSSNRVSVMQGRVHLGGALSGRDIEAVNKTVSGLAKLLFPDPEQSVPDDDLEWIVRAALEARRRVKEQQKRCFKSEFRNTHFSYILGAEGVEQFVSTPELHSDEAIEGDPLPPGQVWAVSPGGAASGPGLYRIEVASGPGAGVKVLNQPTPPAFRESVKVGEQNLYTRAKELVGNRNPREHKARFRCAR
jgi:ATP-dependent Lon protease